MPKRETVIRFTLFFIGLWVSSLGISFATKAELGVSPISGIPYVLSVGLPLTMGTFTFLFNSLFVIGQIIILRKEFEIFQLIQFPMLIVFGYFIDMTYDLLSFYNLTSYTQRMLFLVAGCIILALGISVQVTAGVLLLSGEALIKAIAYKLNKEFGLIKVYFDTTMVVLTIIISLGMLHKLIGVREGTLLAALTVGLIVRLFNKRLAFIDHWLIAGRNKENKDGAIN